MNRETTDRVLVGLLLALALIGVAVVGRVLGEQIGDAAGTTYEAPDPDDLADDLRRLSEETYG